MSKDFFDLFFEQLDNQREIDSFTESAELESLGEFETVRIDFEPYDEDGVTTYGGAN